MILLAPDLGVLADGVEEGRRTFANILKYVRMGTSSNFGNMLSMALASLVLPFLPLLPAQILLNNLIYDFSEIGIPFDGVDRRDLARPRVWDMHAILRFTLIMGVCRRCSTSPPSRCCCRSSTPTPNSSAPPGSSNRPRRRSW